MRYVLFAALVASAAVDTGPVRHQGRRPHVGQTIQYFPAGLKEDGSPVARPYAAIITDVHDDGSVNIGVWGDEGDPQVRTNAGHRHLPIWEPGRRVPCNRSCCGWVPE